MSDLADVLELMHTVSTRPLAIRCRVRVWTDNVLFQESMKRWQAGLRRGSATLLAVDRVGEPARFSEEMYHVWHRRPDPLWRVEQEGQGKRTVTILNGQRWWSNGFQDQYWTNIRPDGSLADNVGGDVPRPILRTMLYPGNVPSATSLRVSGFRRYAGREAYVVSGAIVLDERGGGHMFDLGAPHADEVQLLVERASGVLLRCALILDGEEFFRWEMEEVVLDPPLEVSLFVGPRDAKLPTLPPMPEQGGRRS